MIGNILKIIAALALGYALGWIVGAMSGAFLGAVPGLFFREIVDANLSILLSIALSLLLGGILGFLAIRIGNRVFAADDSPLAGTVIGVVIGLLVLFFMDGAIVLSDTAAFDRSFYILAVIYSGVLGSDIGSIIFSVFGATRVTRNILETRKETVNNRERLEEIKMSLGMHSPDKEKRE